MSLLIRTVKKEIRILGLDTCRKGEVFGVIIRGGLFVDGVILLQLPPKHSERGVAGKILATRYYPELRAIMLHDPAHRLKSTVLEKYTRLPVIEVASVKEAGGKYSRFHSNRGDLRYRARLSVKTLEEIVNLTWTRGALPEQARVAHLLAKSRQGPGPGN